MDIFFNLSTDLYIIEVALYLKKVNFFHFFDKKLLQFILNWCIVASEMNEKIGVLQMATKDTDAKMTLDEAKVYLQDKNDFMHFDEALSIVKASGETDFLATLGLTSEAEEVTAKGERAQNYYPIAKIGEDIEGLYAVGEYLDSDKILNEADELYQAYAEREHIEIKQDDAIVMHMRLMNRDAKDVTLETLEADEETKGLLEQLNVVDDDNEFAQTTEEEKKKLLEGLLEAARNKVVVERSAEDELFKLPANERKQSVIDSIKQAFQNKLLVSIGASNDMHLTSKADRKKPEDYAKRFSKYAQGIMARLQDMGSKGQKTEVHKGQLINSMVQTQLSIEERAALYRQLGMVNAAKALEKQKTGFVAKMKNWFGKAYEQRHAMAENMKNNKYKYIALGLGSIAVSVTTPHVSAGKAAGIAAGYAAFIGAGSVIWPLIEKREAMLRQAKKAKNEELIAELNSQGKIKSLWNIYKSMKGEEKKRYLQRAAINTGAGIIGGAIIGAAGFFGQEASAGAVLVKSKFFASSMRILGNLGVQAKFTIEDHLQAQKDQTEESRQKSKMSKISLGVSAIVAFISETVGAANAYLSGNNAPETTGGTGGKASGLMDNPEGETKEVVETETSEVKEPTAEELAAQQAAEEAAAKAAEAAKVEVPSEYSKDMGITERQWNTMHKTGNFEEQYINAHNAQVANEEAFVNADGSEMTTERVVYMSNRIMALAKAHSDGHGGLIARMYDENHREVFANRDGGWMYADGSAVTSTDIAPECWGTEQEVAAFRALYKSINCGDKSDGLDAETFRTLYQRSQQTGTNGNYMDKDECGKVHFIMGKKVAKIIHHEDPAPEPEPKQVKLNDEKINEDKPRQVILNEEIENQDQPHEVTWSEERGTNIDGKNQHPNQLRRGNHVKSSGIEI